MGSYLGPVSGDPGQAGQRCSRFPEICFAFCPSSICWQGHSLLTNVFQESLAFAAQVYDHKFSDGTRHPFNLIEPAHHCEDILFEGY